MSDVAHTVPESQRDQVIEDIGTIPRLSEGPSHAERARTIVAQARQGALATIAHRPAGFPFGSVVSYATLPDGSPILLLSDLAEHAKNLARDARASLLVTEETPAGADPLAYGRVTLIGTARRLDPGGERDEARARYLERHPQATYVDFGDFHLYVLDVADARFVGGFGAMSWVRSGKYAEAEPDPLAGAAKEIIEHMNDDHSEALLAYVKAFGGIPACEEASMTTVDRYGFDVLARAGAERKSVRIGFARDITEPMDVRTEMIRLVQEARSILASG